MATNAEQVRELIGEEIPPGSSDSATLFLDEQIEAWLTQFGNDVEKAVAYGWRVKAGKLAALVDTQEGTSKRAMSDLHKHALEQAKLHNPGVGGSLIPGRTRVHTIVRR